MGHHLITPYPSCVLSPSVLPTPFWGLPEGCNQWPWALDCTSFGNPLPWHVQSGLAATSRFKSIRPGIFLGSFWGLFGIFLRDLWVNRTETQLMENRHGIASKASPLKAESLIERPGWPTNIPHKDRYSRNRRNKNRCEKSHDWLVLGKMIGNYPTGHHLSNQNRISWRYQWVPLQLRALTTYK